MSERQPLGIDPNQLNKCNIDMCRIPNSLIPVEDRRCLYEQHTDPETENAEALGINYSELLESQNRIRQRCLFGEQIYSSRKNSNT